MATKYQTTTVNRVAEFSRSHLSVACYSGDGIDGVRSSVCRHYRALEGGRGRILRTSLWGKTFASSEEHSAECLRLGFSHYYGRNSVEFVMSRAARKRGLTTNDYYYNARAKEGKREPTLFFVRRDTGKRPESYSLESAE